MKIAIVLPMYNEEDNVPLILDHLEVVRKKHHLNQTVIAVNDGSRDSTSRVLKDLKKTYPNLILIDYEQNRGMGGALKEGIKKALADKFEVLIFMDADLTHDGNDIPKFIKKIEGGYDLVLGSRFISGGKMVGVPYFRSLISKMGNIVGKILLNLPVRDATTGFRVGTRDVFEKITLTETGFGIQLEETVLAAASGFKLGEVPIILTTRRFGNSKMIYNGKLIGSYYKLLRKCVRIRFKGA